MTYADRPKDDTSRSRAAAHSQSHTRDPVAPAAQAWPDAGTRLATQRQQIDQLFGPATARLPGMEAQPVQRQAPVVQRTIHPPKPTHITQTQMEQWNAFLVTWNAQVQDTDVAQWIDDREISMWNDDFNFATSFEALKQHVRDQLNAARLDTAASQGIGWGEMLDVIRLIQPAGLCIVNISQNVPYDGGVGTTWYVQGNVSARSQRGGWKNNAMKAEYLDSARTQVRTALEIHNEEVGLRVATV